MPLWLAEAARRLPGEVVLGHSKQEGGCFAFVTFCGKLRVLLHCGLRAEMLGLPSLELSLSLG